VLNSPYQLVPRSLTLFFFAVCTQACGRGPPHKRQLDYYNQCHFYVICVDILFRDSEVDMYSQLPDIPQWLSTQPLTMCSSSLNSAGCYEYAGPQSSSPLQLSSPCTPSGSACSMFTGVSCGNFPPDPFYNQPPMNDYQPLIDDYYNMSYQPTTR